MYILDGLGACAILMVIIGIVISAIGVLLWRWQENRGIESDDEGVWSPYPNSIRETLFVIGSALIGSGVLFLFFHVTFVYP